MTTIKVIDGALTRSIGPSNGLPLIFLPAFGDTGHCYQGIFSSDLSKTFHLTSIDLWGFGASPIRTNVKTFNEFCTALEKLVLSIDAEQPIGLIGHSIAGSMATEVATRLGKRISGVFSIEGNLTPYDAMFTGKACNFDDPNAFKKNFLNEVWEMGHTADALRHYYSSAHQANPDIMWHLGRDVSKISVGNKLGQTFQQLTIPSLYYWSKLSTPIQTQKWIMSEDIPNLIYTDAGHWPMVEKPKATAKAINDFFINLS